MNIYELEQIFSSPPFVVRVRNFSESTDCLLGDLKEGDFFQFLRTQSGKYFYAGKKYYHEEHRCHYVNVINENNTEFGGMMFINEVRKFKI